MTILPTMALNGIDEGGPDNSGGAQSDCHKFGAHDIDIMAGAEQSHYHRSGYSEGQGTDQITGVANSPTLRSESAWTTHNSLVSYLSRLNYTLLDRYLLTVSFRADGSSRFSKGKKWGYFPAAALAWKINN